MTSSSAPTVAEAAELRAPELLLAVDQTTNTDALRALRDKENLRARPRKTVLRAIAARLEYLDDWLEIPGLWPPKPSASPCKLVDAQEISQP